MQTWIIEQDIFMLFMLIVLFIYLIILRKESRKDTVKELKVVYKVWTQGKDNQYTWSNWRKGTFICWDKDKSGDIEYVYARIKAEDGTVIHAYLENMKFVI